MAEVSLQEYCDEVRELIERESFDQAIAICQHILKHYPKHLRTYSLLGEACLEKNEFQEAKDIFQRVLSADPENLTARVGLSVVYKEDGLLDEAIWQLERAFELAPGNSQIWEELSQLYQQKGIRKGPRLKLNSVALGRIYAQGGLFHQAISEFRASLERDPRRVDVQVALAEALWHNEQRLEAAEVCRNILEKLPHCLKANLILGEILLRGGNEEEGEALLQRAKELDPENRLAQELFGTRSPLPLEEVKVPRLGEEEVGLPAPPVPTAAVEAPPAVEGVELPEELPFWMEEAPEEAAPAPEVEEAPEAFPTVPAVEGISLEEIEEAEELPEWLRELREKVAEEEEVVPEEAPPAVEEAPPVEELEEVPAWLKELEAAPPVEVPAEEAHPPEELEEVPAWLEEMEAQAEEVPPTPVEEIMPEAAAEAPEEAPPVEEVPEVVEEMPEAVAPEVVAEVPMEEVPEAMPPEAVEEVPEAMPPEAVEEVPEAVAEAPPVEEVPEVVEEVPEAVAPEVPVEEVPEAVPPEVPVEEMPEAVAEAPPVEEVPEVVEEVPEAVPAEAVPTAPLEVEAGPPEMAEYEARLQDHPRDYQTRLALARLYSEARTWEKALKHYGALIRFGKLLDMVISDLEALKSDLAEDHRLWELLGDAYMREDRLTEALQAYRQAHNLLLQAS